MRRALGLAAALVAGLAGTVLAGAMYRNDSGAVARAVRIEFSEPVEITSTYPSFPERNPQGPSTVIVLSGGEVPAGGWLTFSWRPDAARVVRVEWMASLPRPNLGFTNPKAKPEVHGDLLNPAFFAHPAYVMQGVSDRDKAFALPLRGVPELKFYPVAADLPLDALTWTFEVSHPEGIGAAIEDDTLYIWGNNSDWQGYGEVRLHVVASDGRKGWVEIPVVVFCSDRNLVNPQGKKDYFVPWGVILDINRILSTEEHMRQYNKPDLGLLDRSLRFSRWRPMEYRKDFEADCRWINEQVHPGWSRTTQFALVDVLLMDMVRMGANGLRFWNVYLIETPSSSKILALYDRAFAGGPTKYPVEETYVINEAHRLGLSVLIGNMIEIAYGRNGRAEIYFAQVTDLADFVDNFEEINSKSIERWTQLGVDIVDVCPQLNEINGGPRTPEEAVPLGAAIERLATSARHFFPGPLYHAATVWSERFPYPQGRNNLTAGFWSSFDIIGLSAYGYRLTPYQSPSLDQLVEGWRQLIRRYFQPFQVLHSKPLLITTNGTFAVAGCANYAMGCNETPDYDPARVSIDDMKAYYMAQHIAFSDLEGYYGPGWHMFPLIPFAGGARDTRTSSPRLKVEDTIQELFLGASTPPPIRIDGKPDDWLEVQRIWVKPNTQVGARTTLAAVAFAEDASYWYFLIEFRAPPVDPGRVLVFMDVNGDHVSDLIITLSNLWTQHGDWMGPMNIARDGEPYPLVGMADSIDCGLGIEFRVARRFLEPFLTRSPVEVRFQHFDSKWILLGETGWIALKAGGR